MQIEDIVAKFSTGIFVWYNFKENAAILYLYSINKDKEIESFLKNKGNVTLCNIKKRNENIDDVKKFVKREIRRNNKYDIIIMDPPSFGRGSKNEVWQIEKDLYDLVKDTASLLSDDASLFIINTYTTGLSKTVLENILTLTIPKKGTILSEELGFKDNQGLILPCGITTRWQK